MTTLQELMSIVENRFNAYLENGEEPPAEVVSYRNWLTATTAQVNATSTTSSSGLLTDGVETFFVLLDPSTNQVGYYRVDNGAAYTPVDTPVAVADRELLTASYIAITTVSGQWTSNDELTLKQFTNTTNNTIESTQWFNGATLLTSTPVIGQDVISPDKLFTSTLDAINRKLFTTIASDNAPDSQAQSRVLARLMGFQDEASGTSRYQRLRVSLGLGLKSSGVSKAMSATVQRGANTTAYVANDIVGEKMTLSSVAAANSRQYLLRADLILNISTVPSGIGDLRLFLFNADPTATTIADNGAFSLNAADRSKLVFPEGISLGTPKLILGGGTVVCQPSPANTPFVMGATANLWAVLVTEAGFTPAANSETYSLRLHFVEV